MLQRWVVFDLLNATIVQGLSEPNVVVKASFMFGDSVSDQVVVLLFQHAMEFLWFWGWVLSDVEDVRQFGGAELGLKKRNQLVSLAWVAVERVGLKIKLVKNWLLHFLVSGIVKKFKDFCW